MNQPAIYSIGTAVPANRISQEHHYDMIAQANGLTRAESLTLRAIYAKSGIRYRHAVLEEFGAPDAVDNLIWHPSGAVPSAGVGERMKVYEEHAANLVIKAVQDCLSKIPSLESAAITHVVTFSCTGMSAPGLDIQIIEGIGLRRNAERTCINFMGCYAAINALKSAYHITRSEPDAVVLIAGVELCSLHYQKSNDPNQMVANALFSDGAAAAVIAAKELARERAHPAFRMEAFYSEFEGQASQDMVWRIGNSGFDLRLSPEVPAVVQSNIRSLIDRLLERAGISQDEVSYYAIHPGGIKILEACEAALGLDKAQNEQSYEVLKSYGNMSSVTVLFVLKAYMDALSKTRPGKHILACAFGPGITMESMIASTC